eukprot:4418864-Amphidinium_carterae.1
MGPNFGPPCALFPNAYHKPSTDRQNVCSSKSDIVLSLSTLAQEQQDIAFFPGKARKYIAPQNRRDRNPK